MKIIRKCFDKCLHLTQKKYIKELLIKFNIKDDISVYSLTVQGVRLEKNQKQADEISIKNYQ